MEKKPQQQRKIKKKKRRAHKVLEYAEIRGNRI